MESLLGNNLKKLNGGRVVKLLWRLSDPLFHFHA